jgi:hypothetical protein
MAQATPTIMRWERVQGELSASKDNFIPPQNMQSQAHPPLSAPILSTRVCICRGNTCALHKAGVPSLTYSQRGQCIAGEKSDFCPLSTIQKEPDRQTEQNYRMSSKGSCCPYFLNWRMYQKFFRLVTVLGGYPSYLGGIGRRIEV